MAQNLDVHKHGLVSLTDSPNFPAGTQGDEYTVRDAGKIGGSSGPTLQVGRRILCITDSAAGDYATVGANWKCEDMSLVLAATRTLTALESGGTFHLNSTTEFVTTLPTAALGLKYRLRIGGAPSGASYTVVTASSANVMKGQVYSLDVNSATDPDFETSGGDTLTFVDGKAVEGDYADFDCDGTDWHVSVFCSVFDAATFTTAS